MRLRTLALTVALALAPGLVAAQAPTVTYTVSGSSGDWFLDFNVANNFTTMEVLYFFGTYLSSGSDVVGTPYHWMEWNGGAPWSNASNGGSSIQYNNNWIVQIDNEVLPGGSLNGFIAHSTAVTAPETVQWYAYLYGYTNYTGSDAFIQGLDPAFEGIASLPVTATPEPATLALLASGLAGVGGIRLRRRRKHVDG